MLVQDWEQLVPGALPTIVLRVQDGHVLEPGRGKPLPVLRRDERIAGGHPEHFWIPLRCDLVRPHVNGDDRGAGPVRNIHLGKEHGAVKLAEDGSNVLLGSEPLRSGGAFLRHAARVLIADGDRPAEHAALGVDLVGRKDRGVFHQLAIRVPSRRRQGTDFAQPDRFCRRPRDPHRDRPEDQPGDHHGRDSNHRPSPFEPHAFHPLQWLLPVSTLAYVCPPRIRATARPHPASRAGHHR